MQDQTASREKIKRILLTSSSSNNIDYNESKLSPESINALKKYAQDNPKDLYDLLLKFQKEISDTDIPLYALALLCSAKTEYAVLKEVFQVFVTDILLVIRFAEITQKELVATRIIGPIKKILKYRLARLNEDDIALYFSEPEFTFKVTLNDLIQLINPIFRDTDITTAINWLNKKRYNHKILKQKYPNLYLLTKLINETNINNAELILNAYTGNLRPILPILSAMDQNLYGAALEKIYNKEFAYEGVGAHYIPMIGALTGSIKLFSFKNIVSSLYAYRKLLKMRDPPIKLRGKNALFIDFSGSNLLAYKSQVEDENDQSVRLINQMLAYFTDLGLDTKKTSLFIFDDEVKEITQSNTIESSFNRRLRIYHDKYKLGEIEAPFKKIISSKIAYENIFILTNHAFSYSTLELWEKYRNDINKNAKLFLIQYDPYNFKDIDLPEGYYRIIGWNESSVRNVQNILKQL